MKKVFYYVFLILTVVSGIVCIYQFININPDNLKLVGGLFFETLIFGIFTIILEPRPRITQAQIKHDETVVNQGFFSLVLVAVAVILILFMSSCRTSGYGCHGKGKYITGFKTDRWERKYNKGY